MKLEKSCLYQGAYWGSRSQILMLCGPLWNSENGGGTQSTVQQKGVIW